MVWRCEGCGWSGACLYIDGRRFYWLWISGGWSRNPHFWQRRPEVGHPGVWGCWPNSGFLHFARFAPLRSGWQGVGLEGDIGCAGSCSGRSWVGDRDPSTASAFALVMAASLDDSNIESGDWAGRTQVPHWAFGPVRNDKMWGVELRGRWRGGTMIGLACISMDVDFTRDGVWGAGIEIPTLSQKTRQGWGTRSLGVRGQTAGCSAAVGDDREWVGRGYIVCAGSSSGRVVGR
jgi:hypothetical protein